MKSKVLLIIIVSSIVTSLLFQNCSKLTAFSKISALDSVNPGGVSFTTLVSESNGEGYLGKPEPIEYVKSFENYNCSAEEAITKNIQGISIFDGEKAVVLNDNCMDVNYVVDVTDSNFDFKPFNQEMFLLAGVPYEKKSTFLSEASRATEAFCRSGDDSVGMDILVKYDEFGIASVKIFFGEKNAQDIWNLSVVNYFSVKRSEAPRIYGNEVFRLNISDHILANGLHSAEIDMTVDDKHIVQDLSCYAMNMRPTIPAVADPSIIAQWSFNNNFEEFVNNLTTIAMFSDKAGVFVEGRYGQAVNLNGKDNYVEVSANADINDLSAFSVSAWIMPNGAGGIVQKSSSDASLAMISGWAFGLVEDSSELYFVTPFSQGELRVITEGANLNRTLWNHVIVTWNGSNTPESVNIYINASKVNFATAESGLSESRPSDAEYPLKIGSSGINSQLYEGKIDQIIIWNRVLSAAEVSSLFSTGVAEMQP